MDAKTAEILRAASLALTESLSLEVVLETLLDYLAQLVPYDSANVMLLEDDSRLCVRAIRGYERWGDPGHTRGAMFDARTHSSFTALLAMRKAVLIPDTHEFPGWQHHAGAEHVRNWMGVPLVTGDRIIGLYSVDKAQPRFFSEEHLRLTEALAPQAVVAIQNARLFEQVQRHAAELEERVAERRQAEQALKESEERTRAIIETAHDAFIAIDADGRVTAWNAQAETTFGWRRPEAMGRLLAETIVPPRYREAHTQGLGRFLATGEGPVLNQRLELTGLHRDGHEFPVELTISAVQTGATYTFNAFVHDISDRKRAEQRQAMQFAVTRVLSESATLDEAIPRLLEALGAGMGWDLGEMWLADPDARLLRRAGLWHAPARGTAGPEEVDPGLPDRVWESGQPAWVRDVPAEEGLALSSAARQDVRTAFGLPITSGGEVLGVAAFHGGEVRPPDDQLLELAGDVGRQIGQFAERMRAEERLKASETRYRQLVENATDIIYRTDAYGHVTYVNAVGVRTTGYAEEELIGRPYLSLVRADRRQEADAFYRKQFGERTPSTYAEFPAVTKDGKEVWLGQNVQILT